MNYKIHSSVMNTNSVEKTHHWKVHLHHSHLEVVEEAGGEIILEEEEETSQEEDAVAVLWRSLKKDRIRTQVSHVVKGLINKKSNVIIVINLVIVHMNAGINNMTK